MVQIGNATENCCMVSLFNGFSRTVKVDYGKSVKVLGGSNRTRISR